MPMPMPFIRSVVEMVTTLLTSKQQRERVGDGSQASRKRCHDSRAWRIGAKVTSLRTLKPKT